MNELTVIPKGRRQHKDKGTAARLENCRAAGMASAKASRQRRELARNVPGADHCYLFSRVDGNTEECWNFKGSKNNDGYGNVNWRGKHWLAHRLSFFIVNGYLTEGLLVCHRCDNPGCINPQHLFLGTNKENTMDAVKKGRRILIKNL